MTREEIKQELSDLDYPQARSLNSAKVYRRLRDSICKHTQFLDDVKQLSQFIVRVYCILDDVYSLPICEVCGSVVKCTTQKPGDHNIPKQYERGIINSVCSNSCAQKRASEVTKEKYKRKTGYEHWTQDPEWQRKKAEEYHEKNGVYHHTQHGNWSEVLSNSRENGLHWTQDPEWMEENRKKTLEKTGYEYNIQRPDCQEKERIDIQ